jgi:hypothetical protein
VLAPLLVGCSPHALCREGTGFRVFTRRAPEKHDCVASGSSHGLRLLFRGCPSTEPLHRTPGYPGARRPVSPVRLVCSASLEVSTPSAFPRLGQRHELVKPTSLDRLRLQVLATSWRLHPPQACRPCFMPDPLLGSPSRALFLSRSRALFPAPFPSWRSHRLQGFAPRESPPLGSGV